MLEKKDEIYKQAIDNIRDFEFNEKVAFVFEDMLNRSIPGYKTIVSMLSVLASQHAQENSALYDLGCSLGAVTALLKAGIKKKNCRIIAVDNSEPIIKEFQKNLSSAKDDGLPIECLCQDACDTIVENASVVIMNFTLQFIEKNKRDDLIKNIYSGLNKDGILLLSEKITYDVPSEKAFHIKYYHEFKRSQGYNNLEIEQKQKALKNVLNPDTIEQNKQRLKDAGFSKVYLWYQCFNFVSIFAVK